MPVVQGRHSIGRQSLATPSLAHLGLGMWASNSAGLFSAKWPGLPPFGNCFCEDHQRPGCQSSVVGFQVL